jgi:hypothetical protein
MLIQKLLSDIEFQSSAFDDQQAVIGGAVEYSISTSTTGDNAHAGAFASIKLGDLEITQESGNALFAKLGNGTLYAGPIKTFLHGPVQKITPVHRGSRRHFCWFNSSH